MRYLIVLVLASGCGPIGLAGNACVPADTKPGTEIRMPDGNVAVIERLFRTPNTCPQETPMSARVRRVANPSNRQEWQQK